MTFTELSRQLHLDSPTAQGVSSAYEQSPAQMAPVTHSTPPYVPLILGLLIVLIGIGIVVLVRVKQIAKRLPNG